MTRYRTGLATVVALACGLGLSAPCSAATHGEQLNPTGNPIGDIEISSDVALGLNLGLDHYVSDSWSVGCSLKYIDFGEVDFSIFPPGFDGLICNNGLFGIGSMSLVSLTLGIGLRL